MQKYLFFILVILTSCDPVHDIHIVNGSIDTLFVRVNNYTDHSDRLKVIEYYADSLTPFNKRQYIYIVPPNDILQIGSRIGFGGPSEENIQYDSLFIESENLIITAKSKSTILKLINEYDQEGEYDFIIK